MMKIALTDEEASSICENVGMQDALIARATILICVRGIQILTGLLIRFNVLLVKNHGKTFTSL